MKEGCTHWRITMRVRIRRGSQMSEFRRTSAAVPGTKAQAVRHLKRVFQSMWPSATLRLVRIIPDRQAEKLCIGGTL